MNVEDQTNLGAVYLFELLNSGATQLQKFTAQTTPPVAGTTTAMTGQIEFAANLSLSADASTLVVATVDRRVFPEQAGIDGEKPQTEIQIFRRNQALEYERSASITPSGDHGYQSEISLALSGDGGLLASGVLNPSGESNSLNIHQLLSLIHI